MTQKINVNNSSILYTELVPSSSTLKTNVEYIQINKSNEPHLIVTTSLIGRTYRGVIINNTFWFLVEDLVDLNESSRDRLTLITKLLNSISKEHKGFVNAVDSRGNIREVLMVSSKGLVNKLFT